MERSTYYKISTVIGVAALSQGAFSRPVRRKIWERDKGQSVWSGETEDLTAAHINHSRSTEIYNSESNGRLLTNTEQYIEHFNRHGTESLGLTESQNKWALGTLWNKLKNRDGLPPPEEAGTKLIPLPTKKK